MEYIIHVTGGFLSWLAFSMKWSPSKTGIYFFNKFTQIYWYSSKTLSASPGLHHFQNNLSRHFKCKHYLDFRGIRCSLVSSADSLNQNMYMHQAACPLSVLDWKQKGLQLDRKSFLLSLLLTRVVPLGFHLDPECFPTPPTSILKFEVKC